jgi:hypothetical protein
MIQYPVSRFADLTRNQNWFCCCFVAEMRDVASGEMINVVSQDKAGKIASSNRKTSASRRDLSGEYLQFISPGSAVD